ncbi:glycosyltransferase [Aureibaculum luteum]|uniref:glycosyltransferase n=1 Tax=Aureibaculum luteum TaxID=1548456 RepID=UPI000E53BDA7|nr:glycosyltransferase [Aureibaculum luteum]
MKKKVLFISEYLNPPYDEGIKKTVYNLFLDLDKNYDLKVICRHGFQKKNIHIVQTNALYYSKEVKLLIKDFNPDSIIYLPFQSSTFASYLRLKLFSISAKKTKIALVALQPKPLKVWQKFIVKFIKPKMAFTPSPALHEYWNSIKIQNQLIPLLTDLSIFKPLKNKKDKQELRKKYDLPLDTYIISHMGHLNEGRNLKSLIPLQKEGNQVVVVSSSSTPIDALGKHSLKDDLLKAGILILDRYIEHIEEIYQLSDLYIFPVVKKNSSIGMPLSVLEARACETTVLTTNYGSLSQFLGTDNGGIKYSNPEDFLENVSEIKNNLNPTCGLSKVSELNNAFYNIIHNQINL